MNFFNKFKKKELKMQEHKDIFQVYTTSNCTQCIATKKELERNEIDYIEINIEQCNESFNKVKELGYKQAPIIIINGIHWSGFRPDKIKKYTKKKDHKDE